MILSMSPKDGSLRPLPADLSIEELSNGSLRVAFPDGSVRELIPGAEGEGRMITTLTDGTRIQSDLTMGDGQVTVASISSTGEKTFLSLNENGASMQRITPAGEISNVVPESAAELVQSFREAEAFAQAEEMREQEQIQENTEFGDWNNFGKPGDWQPEQNWQPPQGEFFQKPDYAGSNWVDAGNGSWIAPLQHDAFQQPQHWQPPQNFDGGFNQPMYNQPMYNQPMYNQPPAASFGGPNFGGAQGIIDTNGYPQPTAAFMPTQQFGEFAPPPQSWQPPQQFGEWNNFGKPVNWQPETNWQPPQNFDGGYNQPMYNQPPAASFGGPHFGGAQGIIDTNGYPQPPAAFMPTQQFGEQMPPAAFAPPQGNWQPPQNFDGGFNQPMYNQPPAAFAPPQGNWQPPQSFDGGFNQPPAAFAPPQGNWQPPATGFAPPPPTDASGFPIAAPFEANSTGAPNSFNSGSDFNNAQFVNSNPEIAEVESFGADDSQQQLPPQ
jgi:hypothetical protein